MHDLQWKTKKSEKEIEFIRWNTLVMYLLSVFFLHQGLTCAAVGCGRDSNEHAEAHAMQKKHWVAISISYYLLVSQYF